MINLLNLLLFLGLFIQPDLEKIRQYKLEENIEGGINFSTDPLTKFFIIILLIIIIIFIVIIFNKIIGGKKLTLLKTKSDFIEVLDILNLGFDQRLYLLKVVNQVVLLGVCDKSISYILRLEEDVEKINDYKRNQENDVPYFKNIFDEFIKTMNLKSGEKKQTTINDVLNKIKSIKGVRENTGEDEIGEKEDD